MGISKNMLPHSATVYTKTGMDADRNPVYDSGVELSNIWVTGTIAQGNGSEGKTPADAVTLYFDIVNSKASSSDFTFSKGQKVVYSGKEYFVNSIVTGYSILGLHHYEIGLV